MGIEPTLVAWEATVLPLNYTRTGRDSMQLPVGPQIAGSGRRIEQDQVPNEPPRLRIQLRRMCMRRL